MIEHHHLVYHADVGVLVTDKNSKEILERFLKDVVALICVKPLTEPVLALSDRNAWTGLIGIETSHIAFHFWMVEGYVQFDIYSCKAFDTERVILFLDEFWGSSNARKLVIRREPHQRFQIEEF